MTLDEMIMRLEEIRRDHDDDMPVMAAIQPSWPLRKDVLGIVFDEESGECSIVVSESVEEGSPYADKMLWEGSLY